MIRGGMGGVLRVPDGCIQPPGCPKSLSCSIRYKVFRRQILCTAFVVFGTLLGFFTGETDGSGDAAAPTWGFDSTLSHPDEPDGDDHEGGDFGIEPDGRDEAGIVPSTGIGAEVNSSPEVLKGEPDVEQPDPLDRYFDPEAGVWWVESHRGQVCVGLPWSAEAPLDVVLDDAVDTISGCIEDGITDDDDNPITDSRSFVLWKGPDVAAVATEAPTDPSRLEFTCFRL
jgi:hypothetical protein